MEINGKIYCFFEQWKDIEDYKGIYQVSNLGRVRSLDHYVKTGHNGERKTAGQNFLPPTIVDRNRMERGDYFKKPTAYWFIGCENTVGFSYQNDKEQKIIRNCQRSKGDGLCSEERSMISPDYARNFICDFIIGKQQDIGQLTLF